MARLVDICSPKQWKTIASKDLQDKGYPVYGANGIIGFYNDYNHEEPTIMITCRGATCGTINVSVPKSYINGNAMCLDDLDDSYELEYLYYYLCSYDFSKVISGSAQPQITIQGLEQVLIPDTSIDNQKNIVKLLKQVDELVNKTKKQLKKFDLLVKSRFIEMFGDPLSSDYNSTLKEVAKLERGRFSPRPRNDPKYFGGIYPYIQTGDIAQSDHYLTTYKQTLNEAGICVSKQFEKGVIVIAIVGATIGATSILGIDVYAPDSIIGITVNPKVCNNVYLEMVMRFWRPELLRRAPESARANINLQILEDLPIYLPPMELQEQFSKIVAQVDKSKLAVQESLKELETLKKSLMQQYFG